MEERTGRSDMTKLLVAFRNFANAPKKRHPFNELSVCVCVFYSYCFGQGALI